MFSCQDIVVPDMMLHPNLPSSSAVSKCATSSSSSLMPPEGGGSCVTSSAGAEAFGKVLLYNGQATSERFPTLRLIHFELREDAFVLYRDGAQLDKRPGCILPKNLWGAERIRLRIHLNNSNALGEAGTASAPQFNEKHLRDANLVLREKYPIGKDELWVRPSDLGTSMTIHFKKKMWTLSTLFRKICGVKWPKFVLVASAEINGQTITEISPEFEVRSKEQNNKTRAARGLSLNVPVRRTPETERRECFLRKIHADIMNMKDEICEMENKNKQNLARFEFIRQIASTCQDEYAAKILELCHKHAEKMKKWTA